MYSILVVTSKPLKPLNDSHYPANLKRPPPPPQPEIFKPAASPCIIKDAPEERIALNYKRRRE